MRRSWIISLQRTLDPCWRSWSQTAWPVAWAFWRVRLPKRPWFGGLAGASAGSPAASGPAFGSPAVAAAPGPIRVGRAPSRPPTGGSCPAARAGGLARRRPRPVWPCRVARAAARAGDEGEAQRVAVELVGLAVDPAVEGDDVPLEPDERGRRRRGRPLRDRYAVGRPVDAHRALGLDDQRHRLVVRGGLDVLRGGVLGGRARHDIDGLRRRGLACGPSPPSGPSRGTSPTCPRPASRRGHSSSGSRTRRHRIRTTRSPAPAGPRNRASGAGSPGRRRWSSGRGPTMSTCDSLVICCVASSKSRYVIGPTFMSSVRTTGVPRSSRIRTSPSMWACRTLTPSDVCLLPSPIGWFRSRVGAVGGEPLDLLAVAGRPDHRERLHPQPLAVVVARRSLP